MRLLRKKLEIEIGQTLTRAVDTAQKAIKLVEDKDREIERLVEEKDREIQRLGRELQSLQALRDWPCISRLVH
jgi:hypothetical protein